MNKSFLISLILGVFCMLTQGAESALLAPGNEAPTFSLPTLNGDRLSLRVYCGDTLLKPHINNVRNVVIINFWATYCKPCQQEIPELMRFAQKHADDSIKIFCISIDDKGASLVDPFVKEKGYTLPVLLDPYKKTAQRYGVKALPALFVIDPYGKICYSSTGYDEKESLDEKLEKIVSQARLGYTTQSDSSGVSVNIEEEQKTIAEDIRLSPRDRWEAIVKVECGTPINTIADSLGVLPDQISSWFADLKRAALQLWAADTVIEKANLK